MKNYIKKLINDEFLYFNIEDCYERIGLLYSERLDMYNNKSLNADEINRIKVLLLDKGKWIIETSILLENLARDDEEFYHKRQLTNLIHDFIRLEDISKGNDGHWYEIGIECYLNDGKISEVYFLEEINNHLDKLGIHYDRVCNTSDAINIDKKYGFKLRDYYGEEDKELEELYYMVDVLEYNNTRLNEMMDKDKESDLYKYMFDILKKAFNKLITNYKKLSRGLA